MLPFMSVASKTLIACCCVCRVVSRVSFLCGCAQSKGKEEVEEGPGPAALWITAGAGDRAQSPGPSHLPLGAASLPTSVPFPSSPHLFIFSSIFVAIDPTITLSYPIISTSTRRTTEARPQPPPDLASSSSPSRGRQGQRKRLRTCSTNHETGAIKNPTNQRRVRTATVRRRKKLREIPRVTHSAPRRTYTCPLGGRIKTHPADPSTS